MKRLVVLMAAALLPLCGAAAGTAPVRLVPALGWSVKKQGGFPVSLAADHENNLWVGTEGNGLWKYDARAKSWKQFTAKDGLGDDCIYALAVDGQDRVWAGHLDHGVSVFNGEKWRNYGLVDGPLGDRVFGISVSPKDGDVWVATDMGLARYSQKRNDWDYYTRVSGLSSDQIQGVAFDPAWGLYAATQCHGLATARPDGDYTKWDSVTATAPMPHEVAGNRMLTNLTNGIAEVSVEGISVDGATVPGAPKIFVIAVPTPFGAEGLAGQQTVWSGAKSSGTMDLAMHGYVRSGDWASEIGFPNGFPKDLRLLEDWITGVQDTRKDLWIAYRKSGVQWIDGNISPGVGPAVSRATTENPGSVLVRSMLIQDNGPRYFAVYGGTGGGLMTLPDSPPLAAKGKNPATAPKLPEPAALPQTEDAKVFSRRLGKITQPMAVGEAVYLADDWRTQGDWIGRYGDGYALLCGMGKDGDQVYALQPDYEVSVRLGPNHKTGHDAVIRSQGHATADRRCLYDPTLGQRRNAYVEDGSSDAATYPDDSGGPDLWVTVKVPDGVHSLSLYFANYDAQAGGSSIYRDYDVQLVPWAAADKDIQDAAPLARARVTDFWGGVYKQFMICGPTTYVARIGRNGSFGTRLQGVFLDRVSGDMPDNPGFLPGFDKEHYEPPDEPENYQPTPLTQAAVTLWSQLDNALPLRAALPLQMPFRLWCYRAAVAGQAPPDLLVRWRWQISIWTPEERRQFDAAMKNAHEAAP